MMQGRAGLMSQSRDYYESSVIGPYAYLLAWTDAWERIPSDVASPETFDGVARACLGVARALHDRKHHKVPPPLKIPWPIPGRHAREDPVTGESY